MESKKKYLKQNFYMNVVVFSSFYTFTRNTKFKKGAKNKKKKRKVKARKRGKNIYLLIIYALDINAFFYCSIYLFISLSTLFCNFYSQVMWKKGIIHLIFYDVFFVHSYSKFPIDFYVIIETNNATTIT